MSTLGDIATVAAPTIVALAAIGTSTWQQSRSRTFDRTEREKERRHERKLSDLDYQRKLVDDVIEAMSAADAAVTALEIEWGFRHREEPTEMENDRWEEMLSAVGDASERLGVVTTRMILRFGPRHEVIDTLEKAHRATSNAWWAAIFQEHGQYDTRHTSKRLDEARREASDAVESFLTITGGIVGSAPELD